MVRRRPSGGRRVSPPPDRARAPGAGRSSRAGRWLLLALAAAALFTAGLVIGSSESGTAPFGFGTESRPAASSETPAPPPRGSAGADPAHTDPGTGSRPDPPSSRHRESEFSSEVVPESMEVAELPPPGSGAVVSIVIDDLGRSLDDLDRIRRLGGTVTYAVLPFETQTAEVVAALEREGEELLLHLPMEPTNGANPGPGALTLEMADRELAAGTRRALEAVPGAVGVNHHMGSRLSTDRTAMETILGVIGRRGLFYLDSRTSPDSVAFAAARQLEIPAAERQVFLDPDPRPEAVRYQFRRLLEEARRRGSAIAIGHPHPDTLRVLEEEVPLAIERGYRFVPVSYLLDRSSVAAK